MHPRPGPFLVSIVLLSLVALPAQAADDPAGLDAVRARLDEAWHDVERLDELLDDGDALNDQVLTYMDLAVKAATGIRLPAAEGTDAAAHAKLSRRLARLRDETLDLLIEALDERELDRAGENRREPVNVRAGVLLAQAPVFVPEADDREKLARRIRRKLKRLAKARHPVGADVFESAFKALAALDDLKGLRWLMDEYLHTRKQPEAIARLRAAMRAMHAFEDVPGALRYELVDEMVKRYVAMESLAGQSTTDRSSLAARRFWNEVREDAIPLIQKAAGYPKDARGVALASMLAFQDWLREHDDPRAAPWQDA